MVPCNYELLIRLYLKLSRRKEKKKSFMTEQTIFRPLITPFCYRRSADKFIPCRRSTASRTRVLVVTAGDPSV